MAIVGTLLFGFYLLVAQLFLSMGMSIVWIAIGLAGFVVGQYFLGRWLALRSVHAKPLTEGEHPEISRMVEDLCRSMDLPKPDVYIAEMGTPNAFAVGRRGSGTVVLSNSLLDILDEDEIEGVVAHELAHLDNRDSVLMVLGQSIATIIGFLVFIGVSVIGRKSFIVALFALVLGTIAKFVVTILVLAMSRYREYVADESAASHTGNPESLASALTKITVVNEAQPPEKVETSVSALCISQPGSSLFSTHPAAENRIAALAPEFEPESAIADLADSLETGLDCPACGAVMESEASFCAACGESLETGAAEDEWANT